MTLKSCILIGLVSFSTIGCSSPYDEEPSAPAVPVASPLKSSGHSAPQPRSTGGARTFEYSQNLTFDIPAAWREDPNPKMVDSRYFIKTPSGEVQLTLTSMGGGLNQNIERWVAQVKTEGEQATREKVTIAGVSCPQVDVRGNYNNRVGSDPGMKKNWRLIGIGIPNKSRDFFVKLVGPRDAIKDFKEELNQFLATARFDGGR
jgi:hypothetical protein